ncbi:UNVERIFIED_ORG: hypothetical protein M2420_002496 [Stenotrophomonas maltophilia]
MSRLLMVLLFVVSSASAQSPLPTSEQSFDLFARFMLEGDAEAAAQLTALTGTPMLADRWEDAVDRMVLGDAPADNTRTQAGRELSAQVAQAMRQTGCRSIGSERLDGDDIQVARVAYSCQMPDLAELRGGLTVAQLATLGERDEPAAIRMMADMLQRAPKRTHTDSVILAREGDGDVWVLQDMPPLNLWVQRLLTLPE